MYYVLTERLQADCMILSRTSPKYLLPTSGHKQVKIVPVTSLHNTIKGRERTRRWGTDHASAFGLNERQRRWWSRDRGTRRHSNAIADKAGNEGSSPAVSHKRSGRQLASETVIVCGNSSIGSSDAASPPMRKGDRTARQLEDGTRPREVLQKAA